jgi:hypothetical protein
MSISPVATEKTKYADPSGPSLVDTVSGLSALEGCITIMLETDFSVATGTAPLVGAAMNAGYRQAFEATNEFVRIKF